MTEDFVPPEGFLLDNLFSATSTRSRKQKQRRRLPAHLDPKTPSFMDLPRSKRRDAAASMGWRIRSDVDGSGVFTSHQILPGSRDMPNKDGTQASHWADFYFMSSQPLRAGIFYNAYAQTVPMHVAERIADMAEEAIESRLSPEDQARDQIRSFSRKTRHGREMVFAPHPILESLGRQTRDGAQAQWLNEHWPQLSTLVEARPHANIKLDYNYGIGLEMLVAKQTLDVVTIPEVIADFRARGEVAYTDDALDLAEFLPAIETLLRVKLWRWQAADARARGEAPPDITDPDVLHAFGFESQPIRM
jgi:hypothetical protein